MIRHPGKWRSALFVAGLALSIFRHQRQQQTLQTPSPGNKTTNTDSLIMGAPFGIHTDDLDAMVKRGNIRAWC